MNKKLEFYLIIFLLLVLVSLSSCSLKKTFVDKQHPHQTEEEYQTENTKEGEATDAESAKEPITGVSNVPGIVSALTCMFSPDTCEATKQEHEMDR